MAQHHFTQYIAGVIAPATDIDGLRAYYDAINCKRLETALSAFAVDISHCLMADVPVAIVTPAGGPLSTSVLLCLHGGAFMWGAGAGALLEAIPVAANMGCTVIAIDYRLAPEHLYPAAVDDVLAVYKEVLKDPTSSSVGVYGCSAGGVLTSQMVARLILDQKSLPGALVMLHATGLELGGDSLALASMLNGVAETEIVPSLGGLSYLAQADPSDVLVFPGEHPAVLASFPPALLITGTRDFAASSITTMHRRLMAAGAAAELVMFDGMWHAHHVDTDLPEAHETFTIMGRFFNRHLTSG